MDLLLKNWINKWNKQTQNIIFDLHFLTIFGRLRKSQVFLRVVWVLEVVLISLVGSFFVQRKVQSAPSLFFSQNIFGLTLRLAGW